MVFQSIKPLSQLRFQGLDVSSQALESMFLISSCVDIIQNLIHYDAKFAETCECGNAVSRCLRVMSRSRAAERLPKFFFFILIKKAQWHSAVVPLQIHGSSLVEGLDLINYCQS